MVDGGEGVIPSYPKGGEGGASFYKGFNFYTNLIGPPWEGVESVLLMSKEGVGGGIIPVKKGQIKKKIERRGGPRVRHGSASRKLFRFPTMLSQQISKVSMSALYAKLHTFLPIIDGSWDVPFTAKEERARVLFVTSGEGAETLKSVEAFMKPKSCVVDWEEKPKTSRIRWADQEPAAPLPVVVPVVAPVVVALPQPVDETPFQVVMKALKPKPVVPAVNSAGIKTVVVRNLPRDINELELRTLFGKHGALRDLYIPKNTDRSSPYFGTIKGFALVKFNTAVDSTRAFLALEKGLCIRGKNITLEFAKEDR